MSARPELLRRRAELLAALRAWFVGRGFLEVDTPIASREVIPERHIQPVALSSGEWLQASPEMAMKRLLCAGSGAIFQVAHAFRAGERGRLHAPEFTMVEWYRPGDAMPDGVALLGELIERVAGSPRPTVLRYREAFQRWVGVDPHAVGTDELRRVARQRLGDGFVECGDDRDEWLNLLLAKLVEPRLGINAPELLTHYPASQAALAQVTIDEHGAEVALRFELYWRGVELANGYAELTDADALRRRLERANDLRANDGDPRLPMPEGLLAAMRSPGMPESCGVALGFDRLAMLVLGAESIADVMA
ncbi:MAG: EF-P lysine aminoacylase EpmA [Lacipirellulaceae bacterium]